MSSLNKSDRSLSFKLGCTLFLSLCKPSIQNVAENCGLPIISQLIGWIIFFMLLLILNPLLSSNRKNKVDPTMFSREEIPLYLMGILQFLQIFNPKTNIPNGLSSFISYFLSPIIFYFIITRLIKNTDTLDALLKVMYVFAFVNLLFGIYTSIFGEPSLFFSKVGDDPMAFYTENGTLRVKALTGSEQTYYISIFIFISFSYCRDKFWFKTLSCLMLVQMLFYPAKNPISYLIVVGIYVLLMPKRYNWRYLTLYYLVMILIFSFFINLTINQGIREIDAWWGQTMFSSNTILGRYWRWVVNVEAIVKNPFGTGIGTATKLMLSPNAIIEINPLSTESFDSIGILLANGTKIEEPHNEYIRLAVEGSILSPALLIFTVNNALSTLKDRIICNEVFSTKLLAGFIFAFTFISFFNNHIFGSEEKYVFWLMMGLTFNRYDILQYFSIQRKA